MAEMKQDDNETQRGLSHEAASETANAVFTSRCNVPDEDTSLRGSTCATGSAHLSFAHDVVREKTDVKN
jgi:hypothetical protein